MISGVNTNTTLGTEDILNMLKGLEYVGGREYHGDGENMV